MVRQMSTPTSLHTKGWTVTASEDGQYLYVERPGQPGQIHIKADDEGFAVDLWNHDEQESVASVSALYAELETEQEEDADEVTSEDLHVLRERAAAQALEEYEFGSDYEKTGSASWDYSERDDWTKVVYAEVDDEEDSVRLNLHVRFQPNTADVAEAVAYDLKTGNEVGRMPKVTPTKPLTRAEYLKLGGGCCPSCRSPRIESKYEFSCQGGFVTQAVECSGCGAKWEDVFTLSGYDDLEAPAAQ